MQDDERVACIECGASILPATANRNGGKCAPCNGGFKIDIEAGREHRRLEIEWFNSPQSQYWRELVRRVRSQSEGFVSLSEPEQLYFAMCLLEGEVFNGGFEQYFSNSSCDYYEHAVSGLLSIKATNTIELLRKAKKTLFGAQSVPHSSTGRSEFMIGLGETDAYKKIEADLDVLDRAFCKIPMDSQRNLRHLEMNIHSGATNAKP